jgi:hypothetical protein
MIISWAACSSSLPASLPRGAGTANCAAADATIPAIAGTHRAVAPMAYLAPGCMAAVRNNRSHDVFN